MDSHCSLQMEEIPYSAAVVVELVDRLPTMPTLGPVAITVEMVERFKPVLLVLLVSEEERGAVAEPSILLLVALVVLEAQEVPAAVVEVAERALPMVESAVPAVPVLSSSSPTSRKGTT